MFTRIAVTTLTLTALGAAAFAFAPGETVGHEPINMHMTVIEKNQAWSLKGRITMDPCAYTECQEV